MERNLPVVAADCVDVVQRDYDADTVHWQSAQTARSSERFELAGIKSSRARVERLIVLGNYSPSIGRLFSIDWESSPGVSMAY